MSVRTKRVYDPPAKEDGYRTWFGHDPERFAEFRDRYRSELADHSNQLDELRGRARKQELTILYGAKDEQHNNAAVLAELLQER